MPGALSEALSTFTSIAPQEIDRTNKVSQFVHGGPACRHREGGHRINLHPASIFRGSAEGPGGKEAVRRPHGGGGARVTEKPPLPPTNIPTSERRLSRDYCTRAGLLRKSGAGGN